MPLTMRAMQLPNLLASRRGRLFAFFALYMTEGIPLGFAATAVATQLRRQGVGPAEIGAFVASCYRSRSRLAGKGVALEAWGYPVTLAVDAVTGLLCLLLLLPAIKREKTFSDGRAAGRARHWLDQLSALPMLHAAAQALIYLVPLLGGLVLLGLATRPWQSQAVEGSPVAT